MSCLLLVYHKAKHLTSFDVLEFESLFQPDHTNHRNPGLGYLRKEQVYWLLVEQQNPVLAFSSFVLAHNGAMIGLADHQGLILKQPVKNARPGKNPRQKSRDSPSQHTVQDFGY